MSDDKRSAPRRRTLKTGIIVFANRNATFACAVRDLSASGARLRVDSVINVPDAFDLIIELDGLQASCEVAWRRDMELGVRFLKTRQVTPRRSQIISPALPAPAPTLRRKT